MLSSQPFVVVCAHPVQITQLAQTHATNAHNLHTPQWLQHNQKKATRRMQRVRIELTTLGLWDLRDANCAIAASTLMRGGDLLITNQVRTHTLNNKALMRLNARGTSVQLAVWSGGMIHASGARGGQFPEQPCSQVLSTVDIYTYSFSMSCNDMLC